MRRRQRLGDASSAPQLSLPLALGPWQVSGPWEAWAMSRRRHLVSSGLSLPLPPARVGGSCWRLGQCQRLAAGARRQRSGIAWPRRAGQRRRRRRRASGPRPLPGVERLCRGSWADGATARAGAAREAAGCRLRALVPAAAGSAQRARAWRQRAAPSALLPWPREGRRRRGRGQVHTLRCSARRARRPPRARPCPPVSARARHTRTRASGRPRVERGVAAGRARAVARTRRTCALLGSLQRRIA